MHGYTGIAGFVSSLGVENGATLATQRTKGKRKRARYKNDGGVWDDEKTRRNYKAQGPRLEFTLV